MNFSMRFSCAVCFLAAAHAVDTDEDCSMLQTRSLGTLKTTPAETCEYIDGDSGVGWSIATTTDIQGVGTFHGPFGGVGGVSVSKTITKTCWAGSRATVQLRVVAAGGWDYQHRYKGTDYARVFVNGFEVFTGTSHYSYCREGFTAYGSAEAAAFAAEDSGSCCTKCYSDVEALIDIPPDGNVEIVVQAQTTENLADECLYFSSLTVVPEVETSDPTECEFVDSDTGYGWNPSTMLSGTAFHGPIGQTHASRSITKDCWAGAGVTTQLRVIAAGGWDDARKGVDYLVVLVNGVEVWRGFSYYGNCESGWTAFDAAEAEQFSECCTKCYQDISFTSVVPASGEYWIAVQALTDESVSDEAVYFTGLTVAKDPAWNEGDSTDADYTTTTTVAPTPTPCTPIALPDADPTSCLGRVNHHRTKWGLPPQSENTALHGCVNRQSQYDSQHGAHRSMRMCQTPSQGQGGGGNCANVIDAFYNERWACRETHPVGTPFKTFDHGGTTYYHASRNCGQACLDDDACISYDFVVGSQADSCRFYSEATLPENLHPSVERRLYCAAQTCDGHCGPIMKEGCDLTFAWGEYSGFYTLSWRGNPAFSTQGEACPSQIEGVRCEPGTDLLVYPLSATSRCWETCYLAGAHADDYVCDDTKTADCSAHSDSCYCKSNV
uniref:Apple domain-containing protein n=1 Tax=Noctiluca scintillans TaxID=2966 RepID=A0A7S1AY12_NOCSC|mmetsp:Transcript_63118/g.167347  ORF Transcript_63118/g.167347 Transcript_63118/m.167347 type:complete len:664 (+) Transcript_63118:70-2061(+)